MEAEQALERRAADAERAGRTLAQIDVGVAFVGEHREVVSVGEREQRSPIGFVRHRAFGIGGRTQVSRDGALQDTVRKCREIGQEAACRIGAHEDRLGARRQDRRGVALVERIGQQDRGPRAGLAFGRDDEGGEEQTLARAVQRQDLALGIDVDGEAALEPGGGRVAPSLGAVDRRIFAELMGVGDERFGDESGHGAARIADRERDGRPARRMRIEQIREHGEGRRRQLGKSAWKHHAGILRREGILMRYRSQGNRVPGSPPHRHRHPRRA